MRRTTTRSTVTAAVVAALVTAGATPAAAAPPVHDSSRNTFLYLDTPGCDDGEGRCLLLYVDQGRQSSFVSVGVFDGEEVLGGEAELPAGAFSRTRTTQTLRPTAITLTRYVCDDPEEECKVVGEEEVTVSASAATTGRVTRHSFRYSDQAKDCVARSTTTVRAAPTAGQVTVDGVRYRADGETGTSTYRDFFRGCDFG